jgi:glycerol-3-phosphate dehydrogenase
MAAHPFLADQDAARLARAYGTRAHAFLKDATTAGQLGRWFGPLSEAELDYLRDQEWAVTSEDVLWRRSKLGLHMSEAEAKALKTHLGEI